MHLKTDELIRLELDFDSGHIPPPFSHTYKLRITFGKHFIDTQLDLSYTDREELSEEEIFDEGFSLDDDYQFSGEIPKVWEAPWKELYAKSRWSNKKLDEEGGIKLLAKDAQGQIVRTVPANQQEWQIFAQDYIQAIYEINKKEAPLTIQFYEQEGAVANDYTLTVNFSIRKIEAKINGKNVPADWEQTKELLSNVYLPDYDYGMAKEQKPKRNGYFIETGDGLWHELGKGVINIDASYDAVTKIKEGFKALLPK
jgi:hypothetical protein